MSYSTPPPLYYTIPNAGTQMAALQSGVASPQQSMQLQSSNSDQHLHQISVQLHHIQKTLQGKDEWKSNLCDCCLNIPKCLKGCVCPCVLFGQHASRLNQESCCLIGCQCLCCHCCLLPGYRHQIRLKYNLESGCDCCIPVCCPCCSLIQHDTELNHPHNNQFTSPGPSSQFMR